MSRNGDSTRWQRPYVDFDESSAGLMLFAFEQSAYSRSRLSLVSTSGDQGDLSYDELRMLSVRKSTVRDTIRPDRYKLHTVNIVEGENPSDINTNLIDETLCPRLPLATVSSRASYHLLGLHAVVQAFSHVRTEGLERLNGSSIYLIVETNFMRELNETCPSRTEDKFCLHLPICLILPLLLSPCPSNEPLYS